MCLLYNCVLSLQVTLLHLVRERNACIEAMKLNLEPLPVNGMEKDL